MNLAVWSAILYPTLVGVSRALVVRTQTLVCPKRLNSYEGESSPETIGLVVIMYASNCCGFAMSGIYWPSSGSPLTRRRFGFGGAASAG